MPKKPNVQRKPKQPSRPSQPSKTKKTKTVSMYNTASLSTRFASALRDPFSPDSYGVRVPDPFSFPTATHHIHGEIVIGNSRTSGACAFLPNPIFSLIDITSVSSGATVSGNCVYTPPSSMTPFYVPLSQANGSRCSYGATVPSQLGAIYGEYRVASWGIKISNLMPELSATGKIIIVPLVVGDTAPTFSDLISHDLTANFLSLNTVGVGSSSLGTSSILNFNDAVVLTAQDLLHGDIEVGCSVVNGMFFNFKTAQPVSTEGGYAYGDSINANVIPTNITVATSTTTTGTAFANLVSTSTSTPTVTNVYGTVYNAGYKDPTRMPGGVAWIIYYEGVPVLDNVFNVEYIYHLEGTPNNGNGTTKITPQPSIHNEPCVGTTSIVEASISANTPMKVLTWVTKGAQFLDKASTFATGKGILDHAKNAAAMHPVSNALMKFFRR